MAHSIIMYTLCTQLLITKKTLFVCEFRYCRIVAVPSCRVPSSLLTCPGTQWTSWEDTWLPKRWPSLSFWETVGRGPGDDSAAVDVLQECVPVVNRYTELRNQPVFAHSEVISIRRWKFPKTGFEWLYEQEYLGVTFYCELSK